MTTFYLPLRQLFFGLTVAAICLIGPGDGSCSADEAKRLLLIAGNPSHGFGAHEHYAGLRVLADTLQSAELGLHIDVVRGWPENKDLLAQADSIVIYADGGGRHPALQHMDELTARLDQGCGFVCLHYAVEVPKGEPGEAWLKYLGGYFETEWSVNPHWRAEFESLPEHPITRGVKPFAQLDEWYFHMRFTDREGVTPILQAVAPESTMRRPDGPHSGNPHVRKSVAAGEPQTVAWAFERPDGGRSFGFTGGHFHWNWGDANVRRLVANAILWTADGEVPEDGVRAKPLKVEQLIEHQDFPKPENFNPEETAKQFDLSLRRPPVTPAVVADSPGTAVRLTAADSQRDPANAVAGLQVAEGLEVTLSASEPIIKSLTNLDIDDRGRVWVCEVMNYRRNNGSRPEGDRILVFEDTTGDGVMDEVKTFYQGNEIDSAMGICVLGNEVIVSASPYIWRFFDDNGDGIADRKEAMFTKTGQPQHDHSAHTFLFGPDGKLYWNFGNTGREVNDAEGNPVVDIHGRRVIDNGKPFYGGMVFRCDPDGSNFEVLAHNFRNNYETTVDSFGAIWQSDNDDDGHRGTRINFVMEHGNYGYRSELTGANWQAYRINAESEVPLRHWHLNDPGVIPNMLQTGAGSPSGICVYEGTLLPPRFRNQVLHCDPGPNALRAYPVQPDGAGYSATIEPMVTGNKDPWFRPVDVCVAPDGSLFFTDWYDPGVGGHRQEELHRGRLYRIAPPNTPYRVPTFDYSTVEGAIHALRNPNLAVRYKAWTALHQFGEEAEKGLLKLFADDDPRMRARALWLLGKIDGRGRHYVEKALADRDENVRAAGIRLLRQLDLSPSKVLQENKIAADASPVVRREALIALRFDSGDAMPKLWAELAKTHDGKDRWYLEALGIGSDERSEECYEALLADAGGDWKQGPMVDILWRIRAPAAAGKLVEVIADDELPLADTDRFFRALEYHPADIRSKHLKAAFLNARFAQAAADETKQASSDAIVVRSLERYEPREEITDDAVKAAVARHVERVKGSEEFLRLVRELQPEGANDELLRMAIGEDDDSLGVEAARLVSQGRDGKQRMLTALGEAEEQAAKRLSRRLGLLGNVRGIEVLADVVTDGDRTYVVRSEAVRSLATTPLGAKRLLEVIQAGKLPPDTRLLAGGLLGRSNDESVRVAVAELIPMPAQADARPLPPLDELAKRSGDASRGKTLFEGKATCGNCHVVNGVGKQVGPDLSEIGTKLSREAMFTTILDPSAGISHNFETYAALLDSGQVITGVMVTETEDAVTLRTAEAVDRALPREEIVELKKSEKSLMPEGLHQLVDEQGLVDVVEYLLTLKKADSELGKTTQN